MIKAERYLYGADADGNRGEYRTEYTIISDVSGEELDPDEVYEVDNLLCSREEALKLASCDEEDVYELYHITAEQAIEEHKDDEKDYFIDKEFNRYREENM